MPIRNILRAPLRKVYVLSMVLSINFKYLVSEDMAFTCENLNPSWYNFGQCEAENYKEVVVPVRELKHLGCNLNSSSLTISRYNSLKAWLLWSE